MNRYGFVNSKLAKRGPSVISNRIRDSFICRQIRSGVSWLPRWLYVNSTLVYPTFWYNGPQATISAWTAEYGSDLSIAGSGADVTANYGSPFNDGTDSVKGAGSSQKYFVGSGGTVYDFSTEDLVFECTFTTGDDVTNTNYLIYKASGTDGWAFYNSSGVLRFFLKNTGDTSIFLAVGNIAVNTTYHAIVILDRSGSGIGYLNATAGSSGAISGVSDISNSSVAPSFLLDSKHIIHHIAAWDFGVGGLDSHLQPALVSERFHKLFGTYPQLARGTALPVSYTRASSATIYKYNPTTSAWEGWTMGAGAPRVGGLVGVSQTARGFHGEQQVDNICRYSNAFDSWSMDDAGDSVDANNVNQPTSIKGNYFDGLKCDDTNGNHRFYLNPLAATPSATSYVAAIEVKKATADYLFLNLYQASGGHKYAYFDLTSTCTIGSKASGVDGGVIYLGGIRYIIYIMITAIAEAMRIYFAPCDGDGTPTFSGGSVGATTVNVWVANAMVHQGVYPTSYINVPSTSVVTRQADVPHYKGDDGNLGGVGSNEKGMIEFQCLLPNIDNPSAKSLITICDGGSANDEITLTAAADEALETKIVDESSTEANIQDASTDLFNGTEHTIKVKWKVNSVKQYVDGAPDGTPDTSCTIPDDQDQILPGSSAAGTNQPNGLISNIRIKPRS